MTGVGRGRGAMLALLPTLSKCSAIDLYDQLNLPFPCVWQGGGGLGTLKLLAMALRLLSAQILHPHIP